MRANRTQEAIIQNLKDAGCGEEIITCIMDKLCANEKEDGLKLLASHRQMLLDELHREQKCIDCLDYLVYDLEKTEVFMQERKKKDDNTEK